MAVFGYNMFTDNLAILAEFLSKVGDGYRNMKALAAKYGLHFIPGVIPGYDDRPLRGPARPVIDGDGGELYEDVFKDMFDVALSHQDAVWPWVTITSFKELHEGTTIEPASEYGMRGDGHDE